MFTIKALDTNDGTSGLRFRIWFLNREILSGFTRRHPTKNKGISFAVSKIKYHNGVCSNRVFNRFSFFHRTFYIQKRNAKTYRKTSLTFVKPMRKFYFNANIV